MVLQITITLDENGLVSFNAEGPESDSNVSMLGLLEMAKAIVMNPPQPARSPLMLPRGPLPNGGGR